MLFTLLCGATMEDESMAGTFRAEIICENTTGSPEQTTMVWVPTGNPRIPNEKQRVHFIRFPTANDLQTTGGVLEEHVLVREDDGHLVWWKIKK